MWQVWYFKHMHLLQQSHKSVTLRVSYKSVIKCYIKSVSQQCTPKSVVTRVPYKSVTPSVSYKTRASHDKSIMQSVSPQECRSNITMQRVSPPLSLRAFPLQELFTGVSHQSVIRRVPVQECLTRMFPNSVLPRVSHQSFLQNITPKRSLQGCLTGVP